MKKRVTLKMLAEELQLSVSTISKALKDSPEISSSTILKVRELANKYNFRPNKIAQSLKTNRTGYIGVILPQIVHAFFAKVLYGMEKVANDKGYQLIILVTHEGLERERGALASLLASHVDGIVVSPSFETLKTKTIDHFENVMEKDVPLVLFDRVMSELECDKVFNDDINSAFKATNKLLAKGCKNIAVITTEDYINVGKKRTKGYLKALIEADIETNEDYIVRIPHKWLVDNDFERIKKLIHSLFDKVPVDGLIAVNEIFAAICLRILNERNLDVPKSVQIVTFTDGLISQFSCPSFSTIDQNAELQGETAINLLLDRIFAKEKDTEIHSITIETNLIERESTIN